MSIWLGFSSVPVTVSWPDERRYFSKAILPSLAGSSSTIRLALTWPPSPLPLRAGIPIDIPLVSSVSTALRTCWDSSAVILRKPQLALPISSSDRTLGACNPPMLASSARSLSDWPMTLSTFTDSLTLELIRSLDSVVSLRTSSPWMETDWVLMPSIPKEMVPVPRLRSFRSMFRLRPFMSKASPLPRATKLLRFQMNCAALASALKEPLDAVV